MSIGELAVYLAIALASGLLGQKLAGRSLGGYVVATIVGLIGALVGGRVAQALGAPEPLPLRIGGRTFPFLWAILGAAGVTLIVSYLRGLSPPRRG